MGLWFPLTLALNLYKQILISYPPMGNDTVRVANSHATDYIRFSDIPEAMKLSIYSLFATQKHKIADEVNELIINGTDEVYIVKPIFQSSPAYDRFSLIRLDGREPGKITSYILGEIMFIYTKGAGDQLPEVLGWGRKKKDLERPTELTGTIVGKGVIDDLLETMTALGEHIPQDERLAVNRGKIDLS